MSKYNPLINTYSTKKTKSYTIFTNYLSEDSKLLLEYLTFFQEFVMLIFFSSTCHKCMLNLPRYLFITYDEKENDRPKIKLY